MTISVSCVEYSVDISSTDPSRLLDLIRRTAWLRWSGKQFNKYYKTTTYLNNPRKSSKGCYAYIKNVNGKDVVRFEMRFKASKFKRMKIRGVKDAVLLPPELVFSDVKFVFLDGRKFYEKLKKKHKKMMLKRVQCCQNLQ